MKTYVEFQWINKEYLNPRVILQARNSKSPNVHCTWEYSSLKHVEIYILITPLFRFAKDNKTTPKNKHIDIYNYRLLEKRESSQPYRE